MNATPNAAIPVRRRVCLESCGGSAWSPGLVAAAYLSDSGRRPSGFGHLKPSSPLVSAFQTSD
jgi:hypothetical protein